MMISLGIVIADSSLTEHLRPGETRHAGPAQSLLFLPRIMVAPETTAQFQANK